MENNLLQWSVRLAATRPHDNPGFSDLMPLLAHHYKMLEKMVDFLGPFNAKQRSSTGGYLPPDREMLRQLIKQGGVNDFSYAAFLSAVVRFCEQTKGLRALPTPHPSVIHSIQLPLPAFDLSSIGKGDTMIKIIGVAVPLIVKGLRQIEEIKFIIVRPRLGRLGTASSNDWEVLFFRSNPGYIPDWTDSAQNPRYSGLM